MSLALLGLGSVLVVGRSWLQFDIGSGSVIRWRGLLVPMQGEERRLSEFAAVVIAFEAGDSDSPDRYPVRLRARSGKDFPISSAEHFGESRKQAEFLARFLQLPLADATTDHELIESPESAGETLQQRLGSTDRRVEHAARPVEMACEVFESPGKATIIIPARKSSMAVAFLAVVSGMTLILTPALWRFFSRTETPTALALPFLALTVFGFGVLPLVGAINLTLRARRGRTVVTASASGLVVERQGAWRTETTTLLAPDILDLDYSTFDGTLQSARRAAGVSPGASLMTGDAGPALFGALKRWMPAKGIVVKSRQAPIIFGEGLPAEELGFLKLVLTKALIGR